MTKPCPFTALGRCQLTESDLLGTRVSILNWTLRDCSRFPMG